MAFGFFRRRQKMVIIIMVILMVSFLLSYQTFEMLTERNRDVEIGKASGSEIRLSDLNMARGEIEILSIAGMRMDPLFAGMTAQKDAELAYALLLQEARKSGIKVSDEWAYDYIETAIASYYARAHGVGPLALSA